MKGTLVLLLLLLGGVGGVYVWYMGQEAIETDDKVWEKITPQKMGINQNAMFVAPPEEEPSGELFPGMAGYFKSLVEQTYKEKKGEPAPGFDPETIREIYPGIVMEDFTGVNTEQGFYQMDAEGVLEFVSTGDESEEDATRFITEDGFGRLLVNIGTRTEEPISVGTEVKDLLTTLE